MLQRSLSNYNYMKPTIAFQGSIGANSHLACQKYYQDHEAIAYASFSDVFDAVARGDVVKGMIPLENSYAGRVSEIHNLLQNSNVSIVAEHFFPIEHCLAAIDGSKIEEIKEIYSHPQALMQCYNNLRGLNAKLREYSNTAEAAKYVALQGDKTKAALCSKMAAQINNLHILKENLQDSGKDNVTIFIVISRDAVDPDPKIAPVVTTLLFTIRNITGALYKALGGFATNGVNMLKLESYIPGGFSKEAKFFITIEGHPSEKKIALALEELGFFSKNVKLLGVYYGDKERFTDE